MKLLATKSAAVHATFVNANGRPAKVQGDVSWESSDPNIAKVQAKPDSTLEAMITAGPSAGEAEIFATADADLGEGVSEVEAMISVTVIAQGQAVGGEIHRTHASAQPPGAPPHPDQGLPGGPPPSPDHSLPPSGAHPDQGLPPVAGHPDQGLPGGPPHVSGQPIPGGPKPDQGLPGGPPGHASGQPIPTPPPVTPKK